MGWVTGFGKFIFCQVFEENLFAPFKRRRTNLILIEVALKKDTIDCFRIAHLLHDLPKVGAESTNDRGVELVLMGGLQQDDEFWLI